MSNFDETLEQPSTDPIEQVIEPVADPAPAADTTPAPPPEPQEQTYSWQPTDESGRPMGGKQVIKYTTQEEFAAKFAEQNTLLIRKLRSETRKNRLGIVDDESLPEDSLKMEEPVDFAPRQLSAEERIRLSRELVDPETFDQAADALLEARMGAKPEVLARTLSELQQESIRNRAVAESMRFQASNPDYVVCPENGNAITAWLVRHKLAPVQANFQRAYETLKTAGVLVVASEPEEIPPAPVAQPLPPPEPAPVQEPVIQEPVEPVAAVIPTVPTGLTRGQSSDTGPQRNIAEEIVYKAPDGRTFTGLAALHAMPADEYRRRVVREKGFLEKEAALESLRPARRA